MKAFQSVTGRVIPLLMEDINTDQIIPSAFLRSVGKDKSHGLFAYMRKNADGSVNEEFVFEKPQFQKAPILLAGENFGCGSSREHAVWALAAFGIECVIGKTLADFFRENCLKNGVLPILLKSDDFESLSKLVLAANGNESFTVDLQTCKINAPGGVVFNFDMEPFERLALLEGLDDIGSTLKHLGEIQLWEKQANQSMPYVQKSISRVGLS
jgi:3-isopropylmalate/(R)-2-methylmalate dehydratase small subunit